MFGPTSLQRLPAPLGLKCFHVQSAHSSYLSEAFLDSPPKIPDTQGKADSHEKYLLALSCHNSFK